jgi:hypothetical protein
MSDEVTMIRLYVMRGVYLLNVVVLGLDIWPTILQHEGTWSPAESAAYGLWAALSLLSVLGLRYPIQMLPLLLFQFGYKVIWLIAIALPQWDAFKSTELAQTMFIGVIVDVIAIPWLYVFRNYALRRGDRWTRKA